MKYIRLLILTTIIIFCSGCATIHIQSATTQPVPIKKLSGYADYPANTQELIEEAYLLSRQHLTYLFGSANPNNGGMDCSGTIYYLLKKLNQVNVPRQSNELYRWVKAKGKLYPVKGHRFEAHEFDHLKPGDLLFWSGTYATKRKSQITHVMLYLGKDESGQPLMFGSSNGGVYRGEKMWGVSVFEFKLYNRKNAGKFVGYGCIPNYTCTHRKLTRKYKQ